MNDQDKAQEIAERQQLQTLLKAIIPYLPSPVVKEQLSTTEMGRVKGEYWQGSVLFADLSGFTALSETLGALGKQEGAEEITSIVNDLFEALLEDVGRYGGVLVKFGGDAMTVYFGDADHALRAARTGLALQETMSRRFVDMETRGGVFTLRLRVGVHTGKIFAAQVGYAPGYPLRGMELVVTGSDVNRVAEAQDYAAPGEVCITAETLAQIAAWAEVEPVTGGMYRLQALDLDRPIESPPQAALSPPDDAPLPLLRQYLQALSPYLPIDLTDERITDLSSPELRPGLRPVAVLFANFADLSAILTATADKGEIGLRAVTNSLNMYYARMQDVIGRYGGIVNKVDMYTHGDKLMALFGAPLAHGDEAVRAVRAALEMQAVMSEVNQYVRAVLESVEVPFAPLTQRIGVNFGHVFAGNVGSGREGSRREYSVMGDEVNLAARLMAAAGEAEILISPSVRRQVADRFKLEDLAPIRVKGKAQPISISRPLRPFSEDELAARRQGRRPFIGRVAQLEAMQAAARQAVAGQGQVVTIVGEVGTGKTRLVEVFRECVAGPPGPDSLSRLNCYVTELPAYAQEPYAPIVDLLRRLIRLGGQTVEDVSRLSEWVRAHAPDMVRFLPLLGDLLALPIADNPVTSALTPEQRRDRLFDLIEAVLHAEARRRPLALVVDDLQWADDSSLALLERLARDGNGAPLLLVLCYRPDVSFPTPWTELFHTHALRVTEFSQPDTQRMVAELLETAQLPAGLAQVVWERTQGNLLFVEEFVKSLRETGTLVHSDGRWQLVAPEEGGTAITAIPDTIEGVVLARLDRLEARVRDVLQEASVATASQARFAQPLLEHVHSQPSALPERLRRLVSDGLLALDSELEALAYYFRHALTRDVAYDSLLYARRRELHRLVAQATETLYSDRLDEHVASLAHHYLDAEEWLKAFHYQRRAGERAQTLFANKDAASRFRRVLKIAAERLPDAPVADLVDVHDRLGDVLLLDGRYDEALEAYEGALDFLAQDGSPETIAEFYHEIAVVHERKADFPLALEWLERGLEVLGEQDVIEKARIYNFGGGVFYRQGEREKALEWRQRALQIAQRLKDQSEIANAYLVMAVIYFDLGDADRALDFGQRCLEAYEASGDLAGSVKARNNLGIISRRADQWAQAAEHYREGLRLSEMMGDVMNVGMFANSMGNVYFRQGKLQEAVAAYLRSIAVWQPIGLLAGVTVARINLGKVAITQGDLEIGEAHLADALAVAQEIGARTFLPEIYRWQALLHLACEQYKEALMLAQQACDLARELKDRAEEGSALRLLGQVCAALEQPNEAMDYLVASLECFVELKSVYQAARSCFELALVCLGKSDQEEKEEGKGLLNQARDLFADLGAQWDLAQTERAIEKFWDDPERT
ncbi:MAG: tetratricopeptide repeat protein [Anaerolineae bacterium]|jgi:class 3 adenylate cyclase/tetratricopeptide (TPR) repeat protein